MDPAASALRGYRFRANTRFTLVALEELSPSERDRLGIAASPGDLSTLLLPTAPGLSPKAICDRTARLIQAFRVATPLSALHCDDLGASPDLLAKLVLDAVLEVEYQGQFISGVGATPLFGLPALAQDNDDATSRLSRRALAYGHALALDDATALSTRLYMYNRIPVSPRWTRRLPTAEAVASWIGLESGSDLASALNAHWIEVESDSTTPIWRHFRRHSAPNAARFKLYLNPHPEFLAETVAAAAPILAQHGFTSFKLGRDLPSLLRPDKLVAYAHSRDQIDEAGQAIGRRLRGIPAQVVPFTAALDEDGLLSWGMDPPRSEAIAPWQGRSWRRWVTDRLAVALIAAQEHDAGKAQDFALNRLALEGVDPTSWTPVRVEWNGGDS
jgi:hypothetical protein